MANLVGQDTHEDQEAKVQKRCKHLIRLLDEEIRGTTLVGTGVGS